jgi:transposase
MFFAGIDWADDHHDIVVINEQAEQCDSFRIKHSHQGFTTLEERLKALTCDPANIACIIETSSGLLVSFLLDNGFRVYPVNPNTLERKRKPSKAKTDAIDARLLARHGRNEIDELRPLKPDSSIVEELKVLTRDQAMLIEQQTRLINQLKDCLKSYYPVALMFFTRLQQKVTLAFLETYPTLEHVRQDHPQNIAQFLKNQKHPKPNEAAQKIYTLALEKQLTARMPTVRGKVRLLLTLIRQLKTLMQDIGEYDKEIEKLFFGHTDSAIFSSLPGAGPRLAPRLLSEFGDDRSRFLSYESITSLSGVAPVPKTSGKNTFTVGKRNAYVKPFHQALYHFARQTSLYEPWSKEYYQSKRAQGKSHSATIRQLANVWCRIIFAMWQNNEAYSQEKFLAARQKHKQRVA